MLRTAELVTGGYLVYLIATAFVVGLPLSRRWTLLIGGGTALGSLALMPALGHAWPLARDLLPGAYLIVGYWLSGLLYVRPRTHLEQWLLAVDRRLFDDLGAARFVERAPRPVLEYLELTYLGCYPFVPAGFAVLYLTGHAEVVDRFWAVVLLAAFAAYGALPWLPTRPPRAVADATALDRRVLTVRRLNLLVLDRASIQVNTLPSGHAAAAFAVTLALGDSLPAIAAVFAVIAVSITAASVVGRYHYVMDSISGVFVAVAAWSIVT